MSHYDYKTNQVIRYPPKRCENYPDWLEVDCGCSGGLQWGGESPRECPYCDEVGFIFVNIKSGRIKKCWPGGPFGGSMTKTELNELLSRYPIGQEVVCKTT